MKIVCIQDCVIKSQEPLFKYKFIANKPLEIPKEHSKKILKNKLFKKVEDDKPTL